MDLKHFGDSYDIVKQGLLRWLAPCGKWIAHPMFTGLVDPQKVKDFSHFLGVPLLDRGLLSSLDRDAYLAKTTSCPDHLFLDPTTGLRISQVGHGEAQNFVKSTELVTIAQARPNKLTLVFDQSFSRNYPRRDQIKEKLSWLAERGVYGLTYESHVCFVLVSAKRSVLNEAHKTLLGESGLPSTRLVRVRVE